jgi:hypothetical protein
MITVGNQGSAVDFAPDPDAENCHRFIPEKSNATSGHHPGKKIDALRVDQAFDRLVACEDGAEQDDRHDDHARQIFHASQTIRENLAWLAASEQERDPKRNRGNGVSDIVNCIGEKCDAPRCQHDPELQGRRDRQHDERPFYGPNAPRGCRDGGIDRAMRVAMALAVVMPVTEILRLPLRRQPKPLAYMLQHFPINFIWLPRSK